MTAQFEDSSDADPRRADSLALAIFSDVADKWAS